MNQLQQMLAAMMNNNPEERQHFQNDRQHAQRERHVEESFSLPPGQAVKFLFTQIP